MPRYNYIATSNSKKSKPIKGEMEAVDEATVIAALGRRKLRPLSVTPVKKTGIDLSNILGPGKVKSDDLVIFTRQLSAMVGAGVPLLRSLSSLEAHVESQALKKVLGTIIDEVEGGSTLGDALAKRPDVFNDVYVNMVRAGETAGILDEILKRLAMQQEKSASIRKKIKSAMSYPAVLMVITVLAFFGLMFFVIPQIGDILKNLGGEDAELPLLTQAMLAISQFMLTFWYIVIGATAGAIYGVIKYIHTPMGKRNFHKLVLKTPAVKGIIVKVIVARFSRTFSALSGAGVSVLESLTVTAHALGNSVYEDALLEAAAKVKNGEQLSKVIADDGLFPPIVAQMLTVGEETGQTDTVLIKIADFYEEEVDTAINSISSIIEPVMIVIMGSMVGLIAASVMGPIASLAQNIK